MATIIKDLGPVSAYAYAVTQGYTGTEEEFAELMADYADVGQRAEDAAESALNSKTAAQTAAQTATTKASEASTSATSASGSASAASASASQASGSATSAANSATSASGSATSAAGSATTASTKASEASASATAANTAKTAAQTAKTAAEAAQAAAETAAATFETDTTLTVSGKAADAKTTGDAVNDLKSDLNENNFLIYKKGDEITSHTGNNIVINNGHVTFNPNPSGYWKTMVAPVDCLYIDGIATLKSGGLSGNQSQSIPAFVFTDEKYNVVGAPVYSTITAPHVFAESDVPSGAVYVCACFSMSFTFSFKSIGTRIFEANEAVAEIASETGGTKKTVDAIASLSDIVPDFVIGAYVYNRSTDTMTLTTNAARLTADLRELKLAQGDSVGITDYSIYSIAFGDNSSGGGWYGGGYKTTDVTANNANIYPYVILIKRNDGANITQTDIDAIKSQFHYTGGKKQINITEEFGKAINEVVSDDGIKICNNNYLHFSFDDVGYCILNLINNGASFNSLWDEPFFGMLKRLHDEYGAIFSLYVWDVPNLANIPSKFKAEFMASSKWLKFGFHSYAEGSLADTSYDDAKTHYETFINYVFSKIGGVNSVDRMPRLNYFAGNVNALRALRDANCGCIGFLNTDDTRSAYYLTQEELTYLRTHSLWSDRTNGLQFISTVMRLDWFVSDFSSQYDYNVPVEDNPYDELVYRYGQPAMADLYGGLIVFTHEWQTYSSSYALNSAMVSRIEQVCQFANDYGYDFDYPQNRIPSIASYTVA